MRARDYSLLGKDTARAKTSGLANAKWYATNLSHEDLKQLMARSDSPALRDTAIWLGCMVLFASIGITLWPSAWSMPFWLALWSALWFY